MVQSPFQSQSLPLRHGTEASKSRDGALRQAILAGAGALALAGSAAQTVQAAPCVDNTSVITGNCTGPLKWSLGSGAIVNNGTISSTSTGITTNVGTISGTITSLTNTGLISATNGPGIQARWNAAGGTIVNSGSISATTAGISSTGGTITSLTNSGTISANNTGISANLASIGTLTNTGLITSPSGWGVAIFGSRSIGAIVNSGTIYNGIINISTNPVTIIGASGGVDGSYGVIVASASGTPRTIRNSLSNLIFASGNTRLDIDILIANHTAYNTGANLKYVAPHSITGNFAQTGGALVIGATSPSSVAKLSVSGTATFSGGSIILVPLAGPLIAGDYAVVSAASGLTNSATVLSTGFDAAASVIGGKDLHVILTDIPVVTPPVVTPPVSPPAPSIVDSSQAFFTLADPAASGQSITFGGGTLLVAGTVTQNLESTTAGGGISIQSAATFTAPATINGVFTLTGTGASSSTGTFSSTIGGTGTLVVSDSTFNLAGTFSAGSLNVTPTGALSGSGTVTAPSILQGQISPGNSPGTLTFTAPVGLTSTSVLNIDIDGTGTQGGAGSYDRLLVRNAPITVAGTLRPKLRGITGAASNTYTPGLGTRFDIVHADGGVTGVFDALVQPVAGLAAGTRIDALYTANDVNLVVTPSAYGDLAAAGLPQTANQRAVGGALDSWRPATVLPTETGAVFSALYGLNSGQIAGALDQAAGAVQGDAIIAELSLQRQFGALLDNRMAMQRAGQGGETQQGAHGGGPALRFALGPNRADAVSAPRLGEDPSGSPAGGWVQVFGLDDRLNKDDNAPGVHNLAGGVLAGADVAVRPGIGIGAALGLARDTLDTQDQATAQLDMVNLSTYASVDLGRVFLDGQANGAWTHTEVKRDLTFGGLGRTSGGEARSFNAGAAVRVGYTFTSAGWDLQPSAGIRYDHLDRDNMTETGAGVLSLRVQPGDVDALSSTLVVHAQRQVTLAGAAVAPDLHLGWGHELGDRDAVTSNSFIGGGDAFAVRSAVLDRDRLLAGAGVSVTAGAHLRLFVDYAAEVGENGRSHAIGAGLRYSW